MIARYITSAMHYEEYTIKVPDDFGKWSKKKQKEYIRKHDMDDGEFIETVDVKDRKLTNEIIEIEED